MYSNAHSLGNKHEELELLAQSESYEYHRNHRSIVGKLMTGMATISFGKIGREENEVDLHCM